MYLKRLLIVALAAYQVALVARVREVTSLAELQKLLASHSNVVLKFYGDSCPPCRQFAPVFEKVSDELDYRGTLFIEVNVKIGAIGSLFGGVRSVPYIIFIKNNVLKGSLTGTKTAAQLREALKNHLS